MNYEIVEIFSDLSKEYRARIIINSETMETVFFFFDHYPTQEEVNSVVENYLNQQQGV
jgi:poly(3-hydroxyalkanoate) synthetase